MNNVIKSIALLDLETTNLPEFDGFTTKITELSIVACSVEHLTGLKSSETMPRVLNKLNLCFNPRKLIEDVVTRKTGLDNFMLDNQKPFTHQTANLIRSFLEHLEQPVCLIAHNGLKLDFPVLAKHLRTHDVLLPLLHDNLYCLDSLHAFLQIDFPNEFHTCQSNTCSPINKFKPGYTLCELYKRFYRSEPMVQHHAEADVILLMQCIAAVKDKFILLMNRNASLFSQIKSTGIMIK